MRNAIPELSSSHVFVFPIPPVKSLPLADLVQFLERRAQLLADVAGGSRELQLRLTSLLAAKTEERNVVKYIKGQEQRLEALSTLIDAELSKKKVGGDKEEIAKVAGDAEPAAGSGSASAPVLGGAMWSG